jgi:hypothetical protein
VPLPLGTSGQAHSLLNVIAEGSSFSQTPGPRGGTPPSPGEPDHLAERRARRAVEAGDSAVLLRRAEAAEATVQTLEAHIASLQQRLREAEGDRQRTHELAARLERVEDALRTIRESHRRMAQTIGELRDVTVRLRAAAATGTEPSGAPGVETPEERRREEMAAALAAAVERLRARAEETSPLPVAPGEPERPGQTAPPPAMAPSAAAGPVTAASTAPAPSASATPMAARKPHKHSSSLIGRLLAARAARKHRRQGR